VAATLRLGQRRRRATHDQPNVVEIRPSLFSGATPYENLGLDARKAVNNSRVTRNYVYKAPKRPDGYGQHGGRRPKHLPWQATGWKKMGIWKKDRKVEMWLKWSVNQSNQERTNFGPAKRVVMRRFKLQRQARKNRRFQLEQISRTRMEAQAANHGMKYGFLKNAFKENYVILNRRTLSELGIYDQNVLTTVIEETVPDWRERVEATNTDSKKTYSIEELDSLALPYLETQYPELYTDACIRFNRQVTDWGIEYTIDSGTDEKAWADLIAQTPELANFQIPDHWTQDSNKQEEEVPLEAYFAPKDEELDRQYRQYMGEVRKLQANREEELESGKSPKDLGLREEPLTRDAWFEGKPQSWL